MVIRFCPRCYAENRDQEFCQACGWPLTQASRDSYLQKLIWALRHPEPETRIRAVTLLGQLGDEARPALPELEAMLKSSGDLFLRAEVIKSIAMVAGADAVPMALDGLQDPAVIVRLAAVSSLGMLLGELPRGLRQSVTAALTLAATADPSGGVRQAAGNAVKVPHRPVPPT